MSNYKIAGTFVLSYLFFCFFFLASSIICIMLFLFYFCLVLSVYFCFWLFVFWIIDLLSGLVVYMICLSGLFFSFFGYYYVYRVIVDGVLC